MTLHQIVYAAIDTALTGPNNGDARRHGSSQERLEYLTDAVVSALEKAQANSKTVPGDRTAMNDKETVKAIVPDAYRVRCGSFVRPDADYYEIRSRTRSAALGTGKSDREAWASARAALTSRTAEGISS